MAYEGVSKVRAEAFSPSRVPQNYRWAWDSTIVAAVPGWESGGGPVDLVAGIVGTISGAVAYINSYSGTELSFPASTYVNMGNQAARYGTDLFGSVTIACMHSPETTAQAGLWIYAENGSAMAPFALVWSLGSNSQYSFWNDNNVHGPTSGSIGLGTRNFVIGRRVGDHAASPTLNLFVNGALAATTTSTALDASWNAGSDNPFQAINRFGQFPGYMGAGTIGNILLWNRALSDAEIESLSNDPYGPIRQTRQEYVFIFAPSGVATLTERLAPNNLAGASNIAGLISTLQDDPDSPDGSWLSATNPVVSTAIRVEFPTPSGVPSGAQNFRVLLRKTTGAPTPTIDIQLYQANTLNSLLVDNQAITSTTGEVVQANWNASALTGTLDGSDVECRIVSTVGMGADVAGALPAYDSSGALFTSATMPQTNLVAGSASWPSGMPTHAAGDLLVCLVMTRNSDSTGLLTTVNGTGGSGGWTLNNNAGAMYEASLVGIAFGWKIATSDTEAVSITTTGTATTDRILARVHRFTAADGFAATPIANVGSVTTGTFSAGVDLNMPTVPSGGANELALCMFGSNITTTIAAAGAVTGGTWTEPVQEDTGTNGCFGIQIADDSDGGGVSGGAAAASATSGAFVTLGMRIVPAQIAGSAVNTVDFGAVEWNVQYIPSGPVTGVPYQKYIGGVPFMTQSLGRW